MLIEKVGKQIFVSVKLENAYFQIKVWPNWATLLANISNFVLLDCVMLFN